MPPKANAKGNKNVQSGALLNFFAKQQSKSPRKSTDSQSTPTTTCDESYQIVYENVNLPSTSKRDDEKLNVSTKWSEHLKNNSLVNGESSGRDWQNPCLIPVMRVQSEANATKDLLLNGFDEIHGNEIFFPIDEPIRKFESNIVRCCSTSNCCVAIPSVAPSSAARIVAITTLNFLKWFPRSRALIVCSSNDVSSQWFDALCQVGIDSEEITNVNTITEFKNLRTDIGRVIICGSSLCAVKMMQLKEFGQYHQDIRIVFLELKPNECCNKFKPIVSSLTVTDTFFRICLLTTSYSNTSRRTSVITKRQQTITNMQISDWIEQTESDYSFRSWNIPPGIEVKYWKTESLESKHREAIEMFVMSTKDAFETFFKRGIIPVKDIDKLIWISWDTLKTNENIDRKSVEIAEFLVVIFKFLLIDGPKRAAEFYEYRRNHNKFLMSWVNGNTHIFEILENLKNITSEHAKLDILHNTIETFFKMDSKFRGLIFTKDENGAIVIQDYLKKKFSLKVHLVRMVDRENRSQRTELSMEKITSVFTDGKLPKIAIIPIKTGLFVSNIDTLNATSLTFVISMDRECIFTLKKYQGAYISILHEIYEKLRKDDGRIIVEDSKFSTRNQKNVKIGAVERYEFKFETSRMRLNSAKLPFAYFYPKRDCLKEGLEKTGRNSVQISSKDYNELVQRIKNTNFSSYRKRKSPFLVLEENVKEISLMSDEDINWNSDSQYLGDVKTSKLSIRLAEYLNSQTIIRRARCRRFQYKNETSDEAYIGLLESLIRRIDLLKPSSE